MNLIQRLDMLSTLPEKELLGVLLAATLLEYQALDVCIQELPVSGRQVLDPFCNQSDKRADSGTIGFDQRH